MANVAKRAELLLEAEERLGPHAMQRLDRDALSLGPVARFVDDAEGPLAELCPARQSPQERFFARSFELLRVIAGI